VKVANVDQMRAIERRSADAGVLWQELMENAGLATALEVKRYVEDVVGLSILVLVGSGNNGGDGLVAARYLHDWGAQVHIYLYTNRPDNDTNLALAQQRNIPTTEASADKNLGILDDVLSYVDIVIDSLLGTGKARPIDGAMKDILGKVCATTMEDPDVTLVAVDLPSGLDADSGVCDPACLHVDLTVTLGYLKTGLFTFPAWYHIGELIVVDVGFVEGLADDVITEIITPWWVGDSLPCRPKDANKGTFGKLMTVAGSINYVGAAYLACQSAARVGTGLVTLATPKTLQLMLAAKVVEATYIPLPESESGIISPDAADVIKQQISGYDALLVGCGIGQGDSVKEFIKSLLLISKIKIPVIVDADGLNILAQIPNWWHKLSGDVIITPHPGEMSRLTGLTVEEVQKNRIEVARKYAAEWNIVIVLKGAHTVVAAPDGEVKLSTVANSGLASAGTGDVLAGAVAGLVAQGLYPFTAAACGVYLHADAGEAVVEELGDTGMIASDLLPVLPMVILEAKKTLAFKMNVLY